MPALTRQKSAQKRPYVATIDLNIQKALNHFHPAPQKLVKHAVPERASLLFNKKSARRPQVGYLTSRKSPVRRRQIEIKRASLGVPEDRCEEQKSELLAAELKNRRLNSPRHSVINKKMLARLSQ